MINVTYKSNEYAFSYKIKPDYILVWNDALRITFKAHSLSDAEDIAYNILANAYDHELTY